MYKWADGERLLSGVVSGLAEDTKGVKMSNEIARTCDYCKKAEIIGHEADSSKIVSIQCEGHFLLMRELKEDEPSRPRFNLVDKHFCPECLLKALKEWIETSL